MYSCTYLLIHLRNAVVMYVCIYLFKYLRIGLCIRLFIEFQICVINNSFINVFMYGLMCLVNYVCI